MDKAEQRKLAEQLANGSDLLDFETALEIVQWRPDEARQILQTRADMRRRRRERARLREQRKRAYIEDFG
ncbi:MAG: hypothetical protein ACJ75T_08495 [Solirubrobacterales bacterium]